MKGLLLKDFYLMMRNKKFLFVIVFMTAVLMANQGAEGAGFVIAYVMVLFQELVLNTFSVDEFDSSITFLMALPASRKIYTTEKYFFSFGCGIVGWLVITLIYLAVWPSQSAGTLAAAAIIFVVLTVFQSIVLPVQIQFGGEKGRVILLSGIIIAAVLAGVLDRCFHILERAAAAVDSLSESVPAILVFAGLLLCVASVWLSLMVSFRMMKNKEF